MYKTVTTTQRGNLSFLDQGQPVCLLCISILSKRSALSPLNSHSLSTFSLICFQVFHFALFFRLLHISWLSSDSIWRPYKPLRSFLFEERCCQEWPCKVYLFWSPKPISEFPNLASDRQSNLHLQQQLLLVGDGTVNPAWLEKESIDGPYPDQASTSQHQVHERNEGELLNQHGSSHRLEEHSDLQFIEDVPSDLSNTAENSSSNAIVSKPHKQHTQIDCIGCGQQFAKGHHWKYVSCSGF